jgi:hypothetical protein
LATIARNECRRRVLRDFYGLSYQEVATAMSVSPPAVESLLSRARRRLEDRVGGVRVAAGARVDLPHFVRQPFAGQRVPSLSRRLRRLASSWRRKPLAPGRRRVEWMKAQHARRVELFTLNGNATVMGSVQ